MGGLRVRAAERLPNQPHNRLPTIVMALSQDPNTRKGPGKLPLLPRNFRENSHNQRLLERGGGRKGDDLAAIRLLGVK